MAEADTELQADPAVESEAREMGWVPEAEFKGKPGTWKDAAAYVDYGHSVLPILNGTNRRLKEQAAAQAREIAQLKALVSTSSAAIEDLRKFHDEDTARQVAEVKKQLAAELKAARESGDTDAEVTIQTEIGKLAAAEVAEAGRKTEKKDPPKDAPTYDTSAENAWRTNNDWYGVDMKKSRRTVLIGHEIVEDHPHLNGSDPAFYRELDKRLKVEFGGATDRPGDGKVAGSGGAGDSPRGGSGSGSRSFDSLPADARSAAKSFERELVGEGKLHKTLKDFQAAWAAEFYRQEDRRKE